MAGFGKYKQSFGIVAKVYKKYRGAYNAELFAALLSLLRKHKGEPFAVLDLGCGVGNSTEPLLQMARKLKIPLSIVGCDPDTRMLAVARASAKKQKLPVSYVAGMAEKLPFGRGQFDLAISGAAFHWFATKKAMREIQRVLKPGGTYAVFWTQDVPGKNVIIGRELYRKYQWQGIPRGLRDPKNVKAAFLAGGFSKVRVLKVPYVQKRTMEEALGLVKTNSSYAILSPKDKKTFDREMKKEYVRTFGSRSSKTVTQVINVCIGVRP
jgi:ubiquinone/menaquinone biosynthesis C-methylase UbiE